MEYIHLWGTWLSIMQLFRPRFDATIAALRAALEAKSSATIEHRSLTDTYDRVTPVDFSPLARESSEQSQRSAPAALWLVADEITQARCTHWRCSHAGGQRTSRGR